MKMVFNHTKLFAFLLIGATAVSSCKKDEEEPVVTKKQKTYNYAFNTGQVGAGTAYNGTHPKTMTAVMTVDEMSGNECKITVKLTNTISGEMYMIHAHDAADPASTPNKTPYNETPNAGVLVGHITGTGGDASYSQTANMSFDAITSSYGGFFVVHDPTQQLSTTNLQTYLIVGAFAR